jgi:hypothetical protein
MLERADQSTGAASPSFPASLELLYPETTSDTPSPSYHANPELLYPENPSDTRSPSLASNLEVLHPENQVARAHAGAAKRTLAEPTSAHRSIVGQVLLWIVLIPAIVFLVSNPLGWVVLLLLVLGFAALFAFGGIL